MINGIFGKILSHEMILELEKQLTYARIEKWLHHDIFSFQWWLLLIVLVVPWFIWWKYVNSKRLIEITLFGVMVLIISSYLDAILSELGLWSYKYELVPLWPRLVSADFSVIPVTYMFIYQRFQRWKEFTIAMFIISALFTFVGEPLLNWLNIYCLYGWKHIYSFPIYIMIGLLVKGLLQIMVVHQVKR